jgi:hypothetical protein
MLERVTVPQPPNMRKGRDISSIIQQKRFDAQHKKYWPLGGRKIWCSVHPIKSKETGTDL